MFKSNPILQSLVIISDSWRAGALGSSLPPQWVALPALVVWGRIVHHGLAWRVGKETGCVEHTAECVCFWGFSQPLSCSLTSPVLVTREWPRQVTRLVWSQQLLKCRTFLLPLSFASSPLPSPPLTAAVRGLKDGLAFGRENHRIKVRMEKDLHEHIVQLSLVTGDGRKGLREVKWLTQGHTADCDRRV